MPKPQWMKEKEEYPKAKIKVPYCRDCLFYGEFYMYTKRKGNEITDVHECAKHPGCLNTKYSLSCDDFLPG